LEGHGAWSKELGVRRQESGGRRQLAGGSWQEDETVKGRDGETAKRTKGIVVIRY
jgi:hypothetical protein